MQLLTRTRSRTSPIGLDLGTRGVRAVQLVHTAQGWSLTTLARLEWRLPESAKNAAAAPAAEQIRSCLSRGAFGGRAAVTALGSKDLEYQSLELPEALTAEGTDVGEAIRFEMERLMTLGDGNVQIRHWLLPPTTVPAPNALGVVAKDAAVLDAVGLCASAGLRCQGVDSAGAALCRLGAALRPPPPNEVWGMLDLGAQQTRVVVCVNEVPVVVRPIAAGGEAWTQLIAEALELSVASAEVHKCEHGIALSGRGIRAEQSTGVGGELANLLLGALRPELNRLAAGLKQSYEYALSCYPARQAGDLMLTGGGAGLRNLPEFLSAALGIPVRRASAYLGETGCRLNLGATPPSALPGFALAAGLAMSD
ncbi:MAG TPA: pilus assembly protein PilM [Phycisphaerae bacterium]|nr:pilus assembly protein PilM [Phycisphaerae bacterium]HNU44344.1 pilus assembly protein PilM [Phycisphaerae bacterium]